MSRNQPPDAPQPDAITQAAPLPASGDQVGDYEVLAELGRGGMGAVFIGRDRKLGRRVAIKFLQTDCAALRERFVLEARATASCHHDNIVVIHEVGTHNGNPYIVLEYLQGTALTKQIRRGEPMPTGRAVELMIPVVRALVCAHGRGIVHRDLKPDNVFLTNSGTVKVLDFGLAKVMDATSPPSGGAAPILVADNPDDSTTIPQCLPPLPPSYAPAPDPHATLPPVSPRLTQRGAIMGTIPYMAPEQWGTGDIDHRADLWAVGIMLFEMVVGHHPLPQHAGWNLGREVAISTQPMPPVRTANPRVSDELADIIDACLVKCRDRRMPDAASLLAALEPLLPNRAARQVHAEENPYTGLVAFQEADADRFFGRDADIAAATAHLRDRPLLAIVGPSGAGKSSFVRAGVIPALKRTGEAWSSRILRPGRRPMDALVQLVAPMLGQPPNHTDHANQTNHAQLAPLGDSHGIRQRLLDQPGFLGSVLRTRARQTGKTLLLFVDQLEELYTLATPKEPDSGAAVPERTAFIAALAAICGDATTPVRLVVAIRADFLERVAEDRGFSAELCQQLYFLAPLGPDEMRAALVQPVELAGYHLDPAVAGDIVAHLAHTVGALPLLQFTAAKLWDARNRQTRTLTAASYRALGGVTGALSRHADGVIATFTPAAQSLARRLLLRLVTRKRTRALLALSELADVGPVGEVEAIVETLAQARILVIQTGQGTDARRDSAHAGLGDAAASSAALQPTGEPTIGSTGEPTIELVHESLIATWPLLARWLAEGHEHSTFHAELCQIARQWDERGRPRGLLWRDEALREARLRVGTTWHTLSVQPRAFLAAAFAQHERSARRRRAVLTAAIATLMLIAAGSISAVVTISKATGEARRQAERATEQAAIAEQQRSRAQTQAAMAKAQLARAQAEARAREAAEARERRARQAAEAASAHVAMTNQELATALAVSKTAQARAAAAATAAEAAKADALRANQRLEHLLAIERQRVQRLENQGGGGIAGARDLGPPVPGKPTP